jgi:hypothetical protein
MRVVAKMAWWTRPPLGSDESANTGTTRPRTHEADNVVAQHPA